MKKLEIKNLPSKYQKLWQACLPLLRQCRPGEDEHAKETAETILGYKGKIKFDRDILIPVAMMHDIGHSAILDEHFQYITGEKKIKNGKLVHMLAGAKIASDILSKIKYPKNKIKEITDIISIHDFDQLDLSDAVSYYDTVNKKLFHDIDVLDRFNLDRIEKYRSMYSSIEVLKGFIIKQLDVFIYPEFKAIAKKKLEAINKLK